MRTRDAGKREAPLSWASFVRADYLMDAGFNAFFSYGICDLCHAQALQAIGPKQKVT